MNENNEESETPVKEDPPTEKGPTAGQDPAEHKDTVLPVPTGHSAGELRVVLLGIYLLFAVVFSVFAIGALLMAETDQDKIEAELNGDCPPCNANANKDAARNPTNTNSNANSNSTGQATPSSSVTPTPVKSATPVANASATSTPTPSATATPKGGTSDNTANPKPSATPTPTPTPSKQQFARISIPPKEKVYGFGIITADSYVVLVVIFAGMLGAAIRTSYSFYKHLGLGDFSFSWLWFYLLLPFAGPALSVVIYFVIRGGFYSSSYGEGLTLNLFSFAALGALTGLFSENAMEKLRQVAITLLDDTAPKVQNAQQIMKEKEKEKK